MTSKLVYDAYNPGSSFFKNPRSFSPTPVLHPLANVLKPHAGDDWGTDRQTGVNINAAADGKIVINRFNPGGWGNYVVIEHIRADGSKFRTLYAHLAVRTGLEVGDSISAGDSIGEAGATGGATGIHLHFEIINGGGTSIPSGSTNRLDPATFNNWGGLSHMVGTDADGNPLIAQSTGKIENGTWERTVERIDRNTGAVLGNYLDFTQALDDGAGHLAGYKVYTQNGTGTPLIIYTLNPEGMLVRQSTIGSGGQDVSYTQAGVRIDIDNATGQRTAYVPGIEGGSPLNTNGEIVIGTASDATIIRLANDPLTNSTVTRGGQTYSFASADSLVASQAGLLIIGRGDRLQMMDTATVQGYLNPVTGDLYQEYKQAVPGFQAGDKVWHWGDGSQQLVLRANGEAEHWQWDPQMGNWSLATRQAAPEKTWTITQSDATRITYELFADGGWRLTHVSGNGQTLDVTEPIRGGWIKTDANNKVLDGYLPNGRPILGAAVDDPIIQPMTSDMSWARLQYAEYVTHSIHGLDYRLDPQSGLLYRPLGQDQYDLIDPATGTRSLMTESGTTLVMAGQALALDEMGHYSVRDIPAQSLGHGDEAFDVDTRDGNLYLLNDLRSLGFHANGSVTESTLTPAGQLVMTVDRPIDGHQVKVEFVEDDWGELKAANVVSVDGQPAQTNAFAQILDSQGFDAWGFADGVSGKPGGAALADLYHAYDPQKPSGLQTLASALSRTADALSLLSAIQSGKPLPILASGLRLAASLPGAANDAAAAGFNLSGVTNAVSGVLSLVSLDQALKNGDTLGAVTSGAQALSFAASAYVDFAAQNVLTATTFEATAAAHAAFDGAVGFQQEVGRALPYLNIVNSLAHGDVTGAAVHTLALMNPAFAPVAIAYTVFNLIKGLFGGDDPEPWASGNWGWNEAGQPAPRVSGGDGGEAALSSLMGQLQAILSQLAAQSGNGLGFIPERLPALSFRDNTFHLSDLDYASGAERLPEVRYTTAGQPFNAPAGSDEGYWSLTERFVRVALQHGAIAPRWEADTARLQTQNHLNDAGLTEKDRAARANRLAGPATGASQTFRPVVLDLDGDGIQLTDKAQSGVAFDVDDSGFLKATGWLANEGANSDGFLWLDRNWNGDIDAGSELFSNARMQAGERGVPSLAWVDANGDNQITAADPVWAELKVWRDANANGVGEAGEVWGLAGLGITALNYTTGRFTQNGQTRQLASPEIAADTAGTAAHVIPEGILVNSGNGGISLLATHVDDLSALAANRDGVTGFEDTEVIVSGADLLANDTLGGVAGAGLSLTGVANFRNGSGWLDGNGFVHFRPNANFTGVAGFDYAVSAPGGQTGSVGVDITVQGVNDAPTVTVSQDAQAVYGYESYIYDYNTLTPTPTSPRYTPYTGWDYSQIKTMGYSSYGAHTSTIAWDDPGGEHAGSLRVTDLETPAGPFTYTVVGQPQMGAASVDAQGTWTYTNWYQPNVPGQQPNYWDEYSSRYDRSPDSFRVRVTDSGGGATEVSVQVDHIGSYTVPSGGGGGGLCPIVVDMAGDGFHFSDVDDSNVYEEVNGDGWRHRIAWPKGDAFLAHDADGDGRVSLLEASFTRYSVNAQTDLEGLRAFDSNGDGRLSLLDARWNALGLWRDIDEDGESDPGEFSGLGQAGVTEIDLDAIRAFQVIDGQSVFGHGEVRMADGSTRQYVDLALSYSDSVLATNSNGTSLPVLLPENRGDHLIGGDGDDLLLGQSGDNLIEAGSGDDVIMDDGGDDTLDGGPGDDVIHAGVGDDTIMAGEGDNTVFAGEGGDIVLSGSGHDALMLEQGNDIAYAGAGHDLISGGDGNDLLAGNEGDDRLYGERGWDALFGDGGADELHGQEGDDFLQGGDGDDFLAGGDGADTMRGGAGNDLYVVDNIHDAVEEHADEGVDTINSSISWVLGEHFENLTLTGNDISSGIGNALDNLLTGNNADNRLEGADGSDTLDGGLGADDLIGGLGNDIYVVDDAGDVVTESANQGEDTVLSNITYVLGAELEHLTLTGLGDIDGTGNLLANRLSGNSGANRLDGGAGADTMAGGGGNDTYKVDNPGDFIIENAGEGIDTVQSRVSWTLGENIENLVLLDAAIAGNGNALDNTITGNALANTLNGGAGDDFLDGRQGADMLRGGAGNDTYVVDSTGDVIMELPGEGTDTVQSAISCVLGANLEDLSLVGSANINATGNNANNVLLGNAGANTLAGGAGNDTYLYNRGGGADIWRETDSTPGNVDTARFGADIAHDQIWFRRIGADLEAQVIGGADKVLMKYWYAGNANHIERFEAGDGRILLDGQIDALVSAMAAFAPPPPGQSSLPASYLQALAPALAANWQ